MRSSAAFVAMAAAVAACRSGAEPRQAAGSAEARAPAPAAAVRAPPATGDRHARAAARRRPIVKRVDGTLADRDERSVVVGRPGAPPLLLRVAPATSITLDGQPARADALPPGAEVRASYRTGDGGRPTALTIEARRPVAVAPAAEEDRAHRTDLAPPAEEPPGSEPWEASPDPAVPGGG